MFKVLYHPSPKVLIVQTIKVLDLGVENVEMSLFLATYQCQFTYKGGLNSLLRHNIWKSTSSTFPNTSHILLHLTDQNLHISEGCKCTDMAIGEQMHGKQKHPIQSWAILKVAYSTAEIMSCISSKSLYEDLLTFFMLLSNWQLISYRIPIFHHWGTSPNRA